MANARTTAVSTSSRVRTIDAHSEGEPLRVIVEGFAPAEGIPGDTMLAKRRYARQNLDPLRRALMLEPRGHADMYGCVLTEPTTPDGHIGVLFLHNEGYSTMCGHGIIGLTKVGFDCGLLPLSARKAAKDGLAIDTPAGRVTAFPHLTETGEVDSVSFENVPSFLLERDLEVEVELMGRRRKVVCDIAFGGAYYAYVDASSVDIEITPSSYRSIIDTAMRIKRAVIEQFTIAHPTGDHDLSYLYGTILIDGASSSSRGDEAPAHSRNVCVFAEGEVDRCPTGTGVSGRAAIHHARGELALGETIEIESILDTRFSVTALRETRVGDQPAIVPRVTGRAWITGEHEFQFASDDPLANGFLLR